LQEQWVDLVAALTLLSLVLIAIGIITLARPVSAIGIANRGLAFLIFIVGIAALAYAVAHAPKRFASVSTETAESTPAAAHAPALPPLPADQADFIAAVQRARESVQGAAGETAQAGVRAERKTAICSLLPSALTVSSWIGRITRLGASSDGKGILHVSMAGDIALKTWSNAFADVSDHTLLDPGTAVFKALAQMNEGDVIRFSGHFYGNDLDCVHEMSLTPRRSIEAPAFVFAFGSAEKLMSGD
jgi:hypothetical protein